MTLMPYNHHAVVADDDEFFRIALISILKDRHRVPFVSEAGSLSEALNLMDRNTQDQIAFLDLNMPGMGEIGRLAEVRQAFPSAKVVVVSASVSRSLILSALEAGVHGYISKLAGPLEVSRAVGIVLSGDIYVPASLADLATTSDRPGSVRAEAVNLTPRQREVLGLIVGGASNREIAARLGLGAGTVKVHVAGLLRALNVSKRSEMAAAASRLAEPSRDC